MGQKHSYKYELSLNAKIQVADQMQVFRSHILVKPGNKDILFDDSTEGVLAQLREKVMNII